MGQLYALPGGRRISTTDMVLLMLILVLLYVIVSEVMVLVFASGFRAGAAIGYVKGRTVLDDAASVNKEERNYTDVV